MVLFIGAPEVMIVLLIVVMLFGADKIPEIARGLGKGMRQIKDATNDIKREINDSAEKHSCGFGHYQRHSKRSRCCKRRPRRGYGTYQKKVLNWLIFSFNQASRKVSIILLG